MPSQQGVGGDDEPEPSGPGECPGEGSEDGSVDIVELDPVDLAAQDLHLVAQRDEFGFDGPAWP